uniref:Endonuclease domain-containing 1 protein-like n=1 Tax=Astyanax mexicanus TaxID=7994 RepID=W5LJN0_ASTMX
MLTLRMKMKLGAAVLMLLTLGALGKVVDNFKKCAGFFRDGNPPVFTTIRPRVSSDDADTRYVKICQSYKNQYRYATLYDTANKIPVYSAYKYMRTVKCKVKRRKITWKIEPQVRNPTMQRLQTKQSTENDMTLQNKWPKSELQAYKSDYDNSGYNRGHLYPHCHTPDEETSESTFTLTNAAPQKWKFNDWWYKNVEAKVKIDLTTCVNARRKSYVVTGVVPSTGEEPLTLKNSRVNVPTHFWTAYCCCYNNEQCQFRGFTMQKEDTTPEEFTSLDTFNNKLSALYNKTFKVWYSCTKVLRGGQGG